MNGVMITGAHIALDAKAAPQWKSVTWTQIPAYITAAATSTTRPSSQALQSDRSDPLSTQSAFPEMVPY
jgi:hypothetical protein